MIRTIHENSVESAHHIEKSHRETEILGVYAEQGVPLTDRTVACILGSNDPNYSRPRISELIDKGLLAECGKTRDTLTKKTVRLVRLTRPGELKQLEMF